MAKNIEWRRKSDGFRCHMTEAELSEVVNPDDYEPFADYTKRQLAPPAAPKAAAKPAADAKE
jgi:hypothetical protein